MVRKDGKNWQRKCLAFIAPITVHKVFCGFVTIFVLAAVIIALSVALAVLGRRAELILRLLVPVTCPQRWIGYGFKCFYFSDDTRNWTFSETFCASMGAHLAQFETPEELNFLKRYKGPADHWIGLSRESLYHIWKWTDGTEYNSSFAIKGVGECAYLSDNGVSSAKTYGDRKWICNKLMSYA
ncbi:C-type lectin domain family 2 member D11-like isoform X3 [Dasypus novemcinctus]|uniref:C-type lectin domain family 2 member D11-like isoform X3 n=1 Tax=Dasypus novemcinctus TaxID=9361 RepID=UPI0039C9595D